MKTNITICLLFVLYCNARSWAQENNANFRPTAQKSQEKSTHRSASPENTVPASLHLSQTEIEQLVSSVKRIDELPGFPVKQHTENREQDELNYKLAKEKWYTDNQTLIERFYQENAKRQGSNAKPTE